MATSFCVIEPQKLRFQVNANFYAISGIGWRHLKEKKLLKEEDNK